MFRQKNNRISGFTLIELAIVLGVTGVLFGGLWRLLSTSNTQMRDQATANQHAQVISAVSSYLQSTGTDGGDAYLRGMGGPNATAILNLPTGGANCAGATGNLGICAFLPPGFLSSTTNPYGQTYSIQVLKDGTAAGEMPATYSFMILTVGGDNIPDTSGGRISAMIGGDGGFIYNTNPCASDVCGAFGAWNTAIGTYGFVGVAPVGHIASRTYYSSSQNVSDLWLARKFVTGDNAASPKMNRMFTPLFLGSGDMTETANTGIFYMGMTNNTAATDGGKIYVQGGEILLGATGSIIGTANAVATAVAGGTIELAGNMDNALANPLLKLQGSGGFGGCSQVAGTGLTQSNNCKPLAQFTGDATVAGQLTAYGFYATNFIYNASDVRLKRDIKPLASALEDIMKIKPVSFIFKSSDMKSMGVIAQDLEKVYPQLVTEDTKGFKSVAYEGLIAPLVAAVQELKKENDELRVQLQNQITYQEKMKQEIKALSKR